MESRRPRPVIADATGEGRPTVAKSAEGPIARATTAHAAFGGWNRLAAGLVALFVVAGDLVFAAVAIGFATWRGWTIGFGVGAATAAALNLAACSWLLPRWDRWVAMQGANLERKLERMRRSRLLERPTRWLSHGSIVLFAIACALIGAILGVVLARLASPTPLTRRRVLAACLAEGVFKAALYASIGIGIGSAVGTA